jgi:hypothetical protein
MSTYRTLSNVLTVNVGGATNVAPLASAAALTGATRSARGSSTRSANRPVNDGPFIMADDMFVDRYGVTPLSYV